MSNGQMAATYRLGDLLPKATEAPAAATAPTAVRDTVIEEAALLISQQKGIVEKLQSKLDGLEDERKSLLEMLDDNKAKAEQIRAQLKCFGRYSLPHTEPIDTRNVGSRRAYLLKHEIPSLAAKLQSILRLKRGTWIHGGDLARQLGLISVGQLVDSIEGIEKRGGGKSTHWRLP